MKLVLSEDIKQLIREVVIEEVVCSRIDEYLNEGISREELINKIKKYAATGLLTLSMLGYLAHVYNLTNNEVEVVKHEIENVKQEVKEKEPQLKLLSTNVIGTVYNLTKNQCKSDLSTSASNFRPNPKDPGGHRIVAVERTFMKKLGLKWGDVIYVTGSNDKDIDGYWRVEDTMNKRFAGQKKIDFLVDYDRKLGKWNDLKIYKVVNPEDAENIKSKFLPPLPKQNKV